MTTTESPKASRKSAGASPVETVQFRITGLRPLLMANPQAMLEYADPRVIKLAELRNIKAAKKTEGDWIEEAKIQASLNAYVDEDDVPIIPAFSVRGLIWGASKKWNMGKVVLAAIATEDTIIKHNGPATLSELLETPGFVDRRSIKQGPKRVIRCRPKFWPWSIEPVVTFDKSVIKNGDEILRWLEYAGSMLGLGDSRPTFGKFTVERIG